MSAHVATAAASPTWSADSARLDYQRVCNLVPGCVARLVDIDPELIAISADPARRAEQRRLFVDIADLDRGEWEAIEPVARDVVALLVVDGLLARRVEIADRRSCELIGPGSLLLPSAERAEPNGSLHAYVRWSVFVHARVALLDLGTMLQLWRLPGLATELMARAARRANLLQIAMAFAAVPDLALRIELVLWSLADSWGRRERDGTAITLPLSHHVLAEMTAAHRSSVTLALRTLERRGRLRREGRGRFLLLSSPPLVGCPTLEDAVRLG